MSITEADVTHWLDLKGPGGHIGHIIMEQDSGWYVTACGAWTTGGEVVTVQPRRICRKCREAMASITMKDTL